MLSRKTLGVAGAAILGSMALLVTNTANAVINLTPATGEMAGKVKFAKEALLMGDANTTTVGGVTYYNVTNAANILNVQVDRGIVAGAAAVHYRMTLENMVFVGTTATVADGGTGTASSVGGGAEEDNYFLFSTAGAGAATDDLTVTIAGLGVLPDMPGNIKVEVYRNAFDAQAATNAIDSLTKMLSGAVAVVDGISERGTPGMAVAEVSENFMQLTEGADTAMIGRLRITADRDAQLQSGADVTALSTMLNTASPIAITFKGDFSVGTYSLDTEADCNGLAASDGTTDTNIGSAVGDDGDMEDAKLTPTQPDGSVDIDWYLCLMVDEDNDMALPTGDFTATVEYAALANALGRDDQTVTIGSIGRTGTSVHIPYMTTYAGYNQRIVLSNRGTADATYTISFRPETGVTAMAKDGAMGTLMGGATMTMKSTDVVELSGGSRTAATINLVADPDDVDVTTVIVNKESQDTDTVVHH